MKTSSSFNEELEFVVNIVKLLDIDSGMSRVGFVQFATFVDQVQKISLSQSQRMKKAGDERWMNDR